MSEPQIESRVVSHVPGGCRQSGRLLRRGTVVRDRNHPDAMDGIARCASLSTSRLGACRTGCLPRVLSGYWTDGFGMWDRETGSRSTGNFESGAWQRSALRVLLFHSHTERSRNVTSRIKLACHAFP